MLAGWLARYVRYHPTWDRLATTASAGSDLLILQSNVNWEVGQRVLVVTSVWYDCPKDYADTAGWTGASNRWCKP